MAFVQFDLAALQKHLLVDSLANSTAISDAFVICLPPEDMTFAPGVNTPVAQALWREAKRQLDGSLHARGVEGIETLESVVRQRRLEYGHGGDPLGLPDFMIMSPSDVETLKDWLTHRGLDHRSQNSWASLIQIPLTWGAWSLNILNKSLEAKANPNVPFVHNIPAVEKEWVRGPLLRITSDLQFTHDGVAATAPHDLQSWAAWARILSDSDKVTWLLAMGHDGDGKSYFEKLNGSTSNAFTEPDSSRSGQPFMIELLEGMATSHFLPEPVLSDFWDTLGRQPGFADRFREATQIQQFWGQPVDDDSATDLDLRDLRLMAYRAAARMLTHGRLLPMVIKTLGNDGWRADNLQPHLTHRLVVLAASSSPSVKMYTLFPTTSVLHWRLDPPTHSSHASYGGRFESAAIFTAIHNLSLPQIDAALNTPLRDIGLQPVVWQGGRLKDAPVVGFDPASIQDMGLPFDVQQAMEQLSETEGMEALFFEDTLPNMRGDEILNRIATPDHDWERGISPDDVELLPGMPHEDFLNHLTKTGLLKYADGFETDSQEFARDFISMVDQIGQNTPGEGRSDWLIKVDPDRKPDHVPSDAERIETRKVLLPALLLAAILPDDKKINTYTDFEGFDPRLPDRVLRSFSRLHYLVALSLTKKQNLQHPDNPQPGILEPRIDAVSWDHGRLSLQAAPGITLAEAQQCADDARRLIKKRALTEVANEGWGTIRNLDDNHDLNKALIQRLFDHWGVPLKAWDRWHQGAFNEDSLREMALHAQTLEPDQRATLVFEAVQDVAIQQFWSRATHRPGFYLNAESPGSVKQFAYIRKSDWENMEDFEVLTQSLRNYQKKLTDADPDISSEFHASLTKVIHFLEIKGQKRFSDEIINAHIGIDDVDDILSMIENPRQGRLWALEPGLKEMDFIRHPGNQDLSILNMQFLSSASKLFPPNGQSHEHAQFDSSNIQRIKDFIEVMSPEREKMTWMRSRMHYLSMFRRMYLDQIRSGRPLVVTPEEADKTREFLKTLTENRRASEIGPQDERIISAVNMFLWYAEHKKPEAHALDISVPHDHALRSPQSIHPAWPTLLDEHGAPAHDAASWGQSLKQFSELFKAMGEEERNLLLKNIGRLESQETGWGLIHPTRENRLIELSLLDRVQILGPLVSIAAAYASMPMGADRADLEPCSAGRLWQLLINTNNYVAKYKKEDPAATRLARELLQLAVNSFREADDPTNLSTGTRLMLWTFARDPKRDSLDPATIKTADFFRLHFIHEATVEDIAGLGAPEGDNANAGSDPPQTIFVPTRQKDIDLIIALPEGSHDIYNIDNHMTTPRKAGEMSYHEWWIPETQTEPSPLSDQGAPSKREQVMAEERMFPTSVDMGTSQAQALNVLAKADLGVAKSSGRLRQSLLGAGCPTNQDMPHRPMYVGGIPAGLLLPGSVFDPLVNVWGLNNIRSMDRRSGNPAKTAKNQAEYAPTLFTNYSPFNEENSRQRPHRLMMSRSKVWMDIFPKVYEKDTGTHPADLLTDAEIESCVSQSLSELPKYTPLVQTDIHLEYAVSEKAYTHVAVLDAHLRLSLDWRSTCTLNEAAGHLQDLVARTPSSTPDQEADPLSAEAQRFILLKKTWNPYLGIANDWLMRGAKLDDWDSLKDLPFFEDFSFLLNAKTLAAPWLNDVTRQNHMRDWSSTEAYVVDVHGVAGLDTLEAFVRHAQRNLQASWTVDQHAMFLRNLFSGDPAPASFFTRPIDLHSITSQKLLSNMAQHLCHMAQSSLHSIHGPELDRLKESIQAGEFAIMNPRAALAESLPIEFKDALGQLLQNMRQHILFVGRLSPRRSGMRTRGP